MNRLLIVTCFWMAPFLVDAGKLPESLRIQQDNFAELHALMQPTANELKWREIPWHTNIWEARREAALAGKPVYLWEMDGHPLGCT